MAPSLRWVRKWHAGQNGDVERNALRLHSARSLLPSCSTLAVRIPVSLPMHLTAAPRVVEWAKVHHGVWLPLAQAAPPHLLVPPHVTRTLFRVLSVLVFSLPAAD